MRVLFLGPLQDLAAASERELPAPLDWDGLLDVVEADLAQELRSERVHVACAGCVLTDKTKLLARDGEEVALLPPVCGGQDADR